MSLHFQRQLEKLKKMILTLGTLVEESVEGALRAVTNRDTELAQQLIANDEKIDLMEIDVEEECLHTLACYQPVAHDLRYLIAVLKINNDLERMADLAVNIAEVAMMMAKEPDRTPPPFDMSEEVKMVREMVTLSLDALVNTDNKVAAKVRTMDKEVDEVHRQMYQNVEEAVRETPDRAKLLIQYLSVSRNLERIADHATNVAEDVIYMTRGDVLRHEAAAEPGDATFT